MYVSGNSNSGTFDDSTCRAIETSSLHCVHCNAADGQFYMRPSADAVYATSLLNIRRMAALTPRLRATSFVLSCGTYSRRPVSMSISLTGTLEDDDRIRSRTLCNQAYGCTHIFVLCQILYPK